MKLPVKPYPKFENDERVKALCESINRTYVNDYTNVDEGIEGETEFEWHPENE